MKIEFLVIGAQKAGTTALHKFLSEHSGLYLPESKELHYFDTDRYFYWGANYDRDYHTHFQLAQEGQVIGEITPSYIFREEFAKRINHYNPKIKLVLILRNPIERAYSHYIMQVKKGIEKRPFDQAIKSIPWHIRLRPSRVRNRYHYIQRGLYSRQIMNYLKYFDKNQVLILLNEKLRSEPLKVLNSIYDFLGVSRIDSFEGTTVFSNDYKQLNVDTYKKLYKFYKNDIEKLESITNLNLEKWKY